MYVHATAFTLASTFYKARYVHTYILQYVSNTGLPALVLVLLHGVRYMGSQRT